MTMKEEKRQFVEAMLENFDEKIDTNVYKEGVLKLLLKDTNGGKLYKYRCVNEYALDNLKNGTLYCAEPTSFNDPFDCKIGMGILDSWIQRVGNEFSLVLENLIGVDVLIDQNDESTCVKDDKALINFLHDNKDLLAFIQKLKESKNSNEDLVQVIKNNFEALGKLIVFFMSCRYPEFVKLQSMGDCDFSAFKDIIKKNIDFIEKINNLSDCAKIFEISEDVDAGSLMTFIEQKYNPDNLENVKEIDQTITALSMKIDNSIEQSYRVGCLCTDNKNKLMWSHYGDGHRGFCIEYDFSSCLNFLKNIDLLPVLYSEERVVIPEEIIFEKNKSMQEIEDSYKRALIKSLITKDDVWNYENEWRILIADPKGDGNIEMPPISCIYIGALCTNEDKEQLVKMAKKLHIPVKQMNVDRDHYELHVGSI